MYFVLLLLVGASETITGNLLYKERIAGIVPRLREFIFVAGIGIFLVLLFHGEVGRKDFNIGRIKIWLPTVFLALQWFLSYFIHQKLREREIFLKFFEKPEGKRIRDIYSSYMHEGSESLKALRSIKKLLISLIALGFIAFIITAWFLRIQYRGSARLLIFVFFSFFSLIIATLNSWHEMQFIMMDGHIVPPKQRRFRFFLILVLFIIVFIVMIPVTGSNALMPESYLTALFEWLESIGRFEAPDRDAPAPEFDFGAGPPVIENYLGETTGSMSDGLDLSVVTKIIGWTLLIGLIGGLGVFLLLPVFRGVRGGFSPSTGMRKILSSLKLSMDALRSSVFSLPPHGSSHRWPHPTRTLIIPTADRFCKPFRDFLIGI